MAQRSASPTSDNSFCELGLSKADRQLIDKASDVLAFEAAAFGPKPYYWSRSTTTMHRICFDIEVSLQTLRECTYCHRGAPPSGGVGHSARHHPAALGGNAFGLPRPQARGSLESQTLPVGGEHKEPGPDSLIYGHLRSAPVEADRFHSSL